VATTSVQASAEEATTREQKVLALYRDYGQHIQRLSEDVFMVPSGDGQRAYIVHYGEHEFCSCPDAAFHPEGSCKHLLALGIWHAKSFRCDLCGERYPKAEKVEVHPEQVDFGMFVREGERLCRQCAREAGVL
jgi:predicted nucleic acid-binding Zn finger protein